MENHNSLRQLAAKIPTMQEAVKAGNKPDTIDEDDEQVPGKGRLLDLRSGDNFIELPSREFREANICAKQYIAEYQPKCIHFVWEFGW